MTSHFPGPEEEFAYCRPVGLSRPTYRPVLTLPLHGQGSTLTLHHRTMRDRALPNMAEVKQSWNSYDGEE